MAKLYLFISVFFISCFQLHSQKIILPMDISPLLSANFGELRTNHFHAGLDFKTGGRIGAPVRAVKSGYISRINISPRGYGRALYINHPDGTMTVYGHLDHFAGNIESLACDSQYYKESFSVDLSLNSSQLPVKQGDIIAYSGNTGSSGGPHLHFEIRESEGNVIIDPLPFYKDKINDTRSPEIQSLMFFPQPGKGVVNKKATSQAVRITKSKSGAQSLATPVVAWGDIGIGVKAYDRMNETTNMYGVKTIVLKMDGETVFHSEMKHFSFSESRYLNSFIDWKNWVDNRSFYMKSFIDPGNHLDIYHTPKNGIISINREKLYQFEYTLMDAYGNKTVFSFDVAGQKQAIPVYQPTGVLFSCREENKFSEKGLQLTIPVGNLYKDQYFRLEILNNYTPFSPLYKMSERTPLHSYCPLVLAITKDTYPDKKKYGIVSVDGSRESWLGGDYKEGKLSVNIRELGDFTVKIDSTAPALIPINLQNWTKSGKIQFKVTDNLSGVAEWKGTLNGKYVLFEYDAKSNALFCNYDSKRMKRGAQVLKLLVSDACGNSTVYEKELRF